MIGDIPAQRAATVFEDTNESSKSMPPRLANINLRHELVMSIGVALDLHQVLHPFMCCAQRLLALHSLHFFYCAEGQASARLAAARTQAFSQLSAPAIPSTIDVPYGASNHAYAQIAQAAFEHEDGLLARTEHHMRFIALRLPTVGALVFVQATDCAAAPFTLHACEDLAAVFDKLALGCLACIEHRSMVQQAIAEHAAQVVIAKEASHDSLTELPNRKTLQLRLRQAVAAALGHEHYGAVFFIDIDRFKTVNDSLGHAAGDAVLVAMARRLEAAARDEDTLARMGGDEFILVASNLGDSAEQAVYAAQALATRLAQDCRRPVDVLGSNVHISTSIGICTYPYDELGIETLDSYCENIIRFADTAMYRTKNQGRGGFEFFAPQMQAAANRRVSLEQQLRLALDRNELEVHFQPLVTSFGAVVGAEALLRWNHDSLGVVEPNEFIPIAEESGLIIEIGAWVIEHVCELVRDICTSADYPQFSYISINVSPCQLKHVDFVDDLRACVAKSGAPTSGLRLEITEHAAIDNIEDTIGKMEELNAMGIRMSLDDFGTGYSSLSYLHRLPISILKLDRAFVTSIADHEENQAIVDATIAMASHLGIECVPEGVELEGDVEFFRSRPVHTMQGFYFSAALRRDEFLRVLEHGSLGPIADLVHQLPISWPKDESD